MTYAMLPDELLQRLEVAGVSRDARLLHIEGIVHCATVLSDGHIRIRLPRITDAEDPDACAAELINAGLWQRSTDGYVITHYLKGQGGHQRTAEQVEQAAADNRRRQDAYRERGRRHAAGDHRDCTKRCPDAGLDLRPDHERDNGSNALRDASRNGTLSCPPLSDPKGGKGETDNKGAVAPGSASATPRRSAPRMNTEPHIFVDRHFTGHCLQCDLGKSNAIHQKVPSRIQEAASDILTNGGEAVGIESIATDDDDSKIYNIHASVRGLRWDLQFTGNEADLTFLTMQYPAEYEQRAEALASVFESYLNVGSCETDGGSDGLNIVVCSRRTQELDWDMSGHVPLFVAEYLQSIDTEVAA